MFNNKLLNNVIDCTELLKDIKFRVPYFNTWRKETFLTSSHTQDYSFYKSLNSMCSSSNNVPNIVFHV